VPAAAVIPAPIAYIKVAAVKKLVVGFLALEQPGPPSGYVCECRDAPVILPLTVLFIEVMWWPDLLL
jgi:hypothetical protein